MAGKYKPKRGRGKAKGGSTKKTSKRITKSQMRAFCEAAQSGASEEE